MMQGRVQHWAHPPANEHRNSLHAHEQSFPIFALTNLPQTCSYSFHVLHKLSYNADEEHQNLDHIVWDKLPYTLIENPIYMGEQLSSIGLWENFENLPDIKENSLQYEYVCKTNPVHQRKGCEKEELNVL